MQSAVTNTHKPHLRIRVLGTQAMVGRERVVINGVGAGVDIDRYDFAMVCRLYLCADRVLINFITTSSRLFGGVPWQLC